jgi:hypothetical protein
MRRRAAIKVEGVVGQVRRRRLVYKLRIDTQMDVVEREIYIRQDQTNPTIVVGRNNARPSVSTRLSLREDDSKVMKRKTIDKIHGDH